MTKFSNLLEFVERAQRNRKYPEATAQSLKAALRLYDTELSEEEKVSLEKVKRDFEQITHSVFSKNASKFTAASLATYKSRVLKAFADYEKYGDPAKMSNWSPRVIHRGKKSEQRTSSSAGQTQSHQEDTHFSGQPYVLSDRGAGWRLSIESIAPMTTTMKKDVADIAEKLDEVNKNHENKIA